MFDKESITLIQESATTYMARQALTLSGESNSLAALPSDIELHDLECYNDLRRRARGTMSTASLGAFTDYTKAHAEPGASVFVDADRMSATAVLNLGTPDAPGHADNKAKLELKRSAAFSALLMVASGTKMTQASAAEFLEDWSLEIACMNDAGDIATPKAIAAIRKLTIETMRKLESEEQSLSASRSAFESVQATSKEPIPTTTMFTCQPYSDLRERTFCLRLGISISGDKPTVTLRIIKAEQHNEEMAQELADMIGRTFIEGEIPVLIGAYAKAE